MSALRAMRWRATIEVEFVTHDYPGEPESTTAEFQAVAFKRAVERCEQNVNCTRPEVVLKRVDRVAVPSRTQRNEADNG